jgi:raffinose/stachyose/melibiose transport system substrate-binding protein
MSHRFPPDPARAISRRHFLRWTGGAGLLVGLSRGLPDLVPGARAEAPRELVLISQQGATPDRALPKLLEAFKAANPGVNTKVMLFPEEKFVALYTASQAAGEQVDLLMLNGQDLRRYATSQALLPLDDLPYKNRFIPEALKPVTIESHLWGVPSGAAGGFVIFVNRALLSKYQLDFPKTYDELKAAAATLKKAGVNAFTHPGKVIYMWPVWFFTTFAQTTNNRSIERTVEILDGRGKFTDPDVVQALDLLFQFARDKMFTPGVFSLDFPNAQSEFLTGKAAFYLVHDSLAKPVMEANAPGMELDFILMPNLVGRPVTSQYPGAACGVVLAIPAKIDPARRELATKLLDFLSSDQSDQESVALNGGAVPVNEQVPTPDIPVYGKEKEEISKVVTYLDWYYPPEITRGFQEGLQAGLAGRIKAEDLAKNLQATLERLYGSGYKFVG